MSTCPCHRLLGRWTSWSRAVEPLLSALDLEAHPSVRAFWGETMVLRRLFYQFGWNTWIVFTFSYSNDIPNEYIPWRFKRQRIALGPAPPFALQLPFLEPILVTVWVCVGDGLDLVKEMACLLIPPWSFECSWRHTICRLTSGYVRCTTVCTSIGN